MRNIFKGRVPGRRRLIGAVAAATVGLFQAPARPASAANGNDTILGVTNTATSPTELTDKLQDRAILQMQGGTVKKAATTALIVTGGGPAGYGLIARGGPSGTSNTGGAGVQARGGDGMATFETTTGPGLIATGGRSGTGTPGHGGWVYGGQSTGPACTGAWVRCRGAVDGRGVDASGAVGPTDGLSGVCGVLCVGGVPTPGTVGPGLVATGGRPGGNLPGPPDDGKEDIGGDGILAKGGLRGETSARSKSGILAVHRKGGPALAGHGVMSGVDGLGLYGRSTNSYGGLLTSAKGIAALTMGDVEASTTTGYGARGSADSGTALVGISMSSAGVVGVSAQASGGVFVAKKQDQYALYANNTAATPADVTPVGVTVTGDWLVQDGVKSAAVPTSKGLTLLYAVEGPVAMFEDVGTARLAGGRARVDLDPLFVQTIDPSELFVFLSPRGETPGVYVASQDTKGFEIREQGGGSSAIEVSYRVTARRKGLPAGHRLAAYSPKLTPPDPEVERLRLPQAVMPPLPPHPKRPDPNRGGRVPVAQTEGRR